MEYILLYFNTLLDLSNAMAPYIVFGLFFAGIMHELVPDTIVSEHLGKSSISSVIKATVFGIPLPVCSCGVIPLATSIKKSGASNGATLSFLVSTPITGIDSILATYGMFGWAFTIYRVVTSMIVSMIAGILANVFVKEEPKQAEKKVQTPAFSMAPSAPKSFASTPTFSAVSKVEESTCSSGCGCDNTPSKQKLSLTKALRYAFITLLGDIASPLFYGLFLGALITVAVPSNLSELLIEYNWLSYLIVIAIAVPMYVCATASLPIAAGLMLSGVSAGAAFVFLLAGPATNTVTIGVVKKMLGTKTLSIYLGTIIISSIFFGLGLDYILADVDVKEMLHLHEDASIIAWASSAFLWAFVLYFLLKRTITIKHPFNKF